MSTSSSNKTSPRLVREIPQKEPYKAAATHSAHVKHNAHVEKSDLIKYKIKTDLAEFNSKRPGSQFHPSDVDFIEQLSKRDLNELASMATKNIKTNLANEEFHEMRLLSEHTPSFIDARFYTDVNFVKLANELKRKSVKDDSMSKTASTSAQIKPVNIVGPMIDDKSKKQLNPTAIQPSANSNDQETNRLTTGKHQREQYEFRIGYLEEQMRGLYEQLQIQTQVNVELKKLLIASIGGEELQYKLECLVKDKQRLEIELSNFTKHMETLNEDIEQLKIQCDLWRSKYLAIKVMCNETRLWKQFLYLLNEQNEKCMKNVLEDNETINFKLNEALKLVSLLQTKSNEEVQEELGQEHHSKHYNNLQAVNLLMSTLNGLRRSATYSNKGKEVDFQEHLHSKVKSFKTKTFNEMCAKQMIDQFDWVRTATQSNVEDKLLIENSSEQDFLGNYSTRIAQQIEPEQIGDSLDKLEELIKRIKSNRFNKFSRLFQTINHADHNLLVNICNRCKGEVKVV